MLLFYLSAGSFIAFLVFLAPPQLNIPINSACTMWFPFSYHLGYNLLGVVHLVDVSFMVQLPYPDIKSGNIGRRVTYLVLVSDCLRPALGLGEGVWSSFSSMVTTPWRLGGEGLVRRSFPKGNWTLGLYGLGCTLARYEPSRLLLGRANGAGLFIENQKQVIRGNTSQIHGFPEIC